ncbi:TonB family C-terminal domain-containing protein [Fontimonas thermophila]|uniref:TonB family C-terminal domain-containing protein n=1 Tax=Fontimonas thermophila TaxID=1076937 RepID=A0A1I2K9N8_9GAMM|nr:TonB family C-terminal domain-containing protein [Fontimonas thermophila]
MAAAATEPGEVGGGGRDGYYARVRAHLQRHRQPLIGSDVRGTAVVAFHVAADGRVSALVLQRSAGAAMLDAEALDLVHRASPLPPPPDGRARRLAVPIAFE